MKLPGQQARADAQLMLWIRAECRTWDAMGLPYDNQVRKLATQGIEIRSGMQGNDPNVPECGYCHATDGGRHGRLCPRGGGPGQLPNPPEPVWVLDVAETALALVKHDLQGAMIANGEDPIDPKQWRLRWGQLRQLLESGQLIAVDHRTRGSRL